MPSRRLLVPLVVSALAVALWLWPSRDESPVVDLAGDVSLCVANLRGIHAALVRHVERTGRAPAGSGVRFLAELVASGTLADTPAERARLTCPGPGAAPVPRAVDYRALTALTGADSAYAARDIARFPLVEFPSGGAELEPLVACDNARGLNHAGCMNVLYSDGSVVTLFLDQEIAEGRLPAGASSIPVGQDSPLPDLRKLSQD